jgi:hypothetical protein
MDAIVLWQSALPARQAALKMKLSPTVDREPGEYVIAVARLPRGRAAEATLTVKGRPALHSSGTGVSEFGLYFSFPMSAPLSLDDKDVEFAAQIGALNVRTKFHLKDMVYGGKLEL